MKNLSNSFEDERRSPRQRFADLLWCAFPARSEAEVAAKAARALGCSERTVRNWLRCENDASLTYFFAVAAIAQVEMRLGRRRGPMGRAA
ncbi:helix-turn-helix domain-containing protein [Tropicimonas marinistellae]|uniref:helix-turn-helix domain-containing protein n=1 Tax=Tropicimonas marinistellae TaxID=1739787 RepID=UPI000832531C|nr:helix-turn-helix domain-containing protein [Tropicimonas marinistellae]